MLRLVDPAMAMFPAHGTCLGEPWGALSRCASLQAAVEQVAEIYEFQWHPYFIWMRSVGVGPRQFIASQIPFQYAVESFAQAFVRLNDRLQTRGTEFAGNADVQSIATHPSKLAFHRCLSCLEPRVDRSGVCPIEVAAANRAVVNHCLTMPIESGAALLGMIEYLYVDVSATISQIVQHRGWVHPDSDFYCMIHAALEIDTTRDLLTLANTAWADPQVRPQIAQSLILGAQYLWALYDGLYPDSAG